MSDHDTTGTSVINPGEDGDGQLVRLDQGHVVGTGGLPVRFENPGLPDHIHRAADHDEGAAKRAERQVAALFTLSIIGTIVFLVAYFAIDTEQSAFVPGLGDVGLSNLVLGIALTLALLGIGLGAVHWAKTLMPDEEIVESRHLMRSSDANRQAFVSTLATEGGKSQITRRPLILTTMGTALGLFALPLLVQLVGGLGPLPGDSLSVTFWNGEKDADGKRVFKPLKLVRDPENTPIKATDVTIGSVFHVQPEGLFELEHGVLEEKAKAAVLIMRLNPSDILSQKERDWGYDGIVAYSKICTHVGCPVGLYEQQTHHLLCPCHQSTFDVTDDCRVIFGPAKRRLPQLKITVDDEGYLIATQPFREAVGPSFWERGSR